VRIRWIAGIAAVSFIAIVASVSARDAKQSSSLDEYAHGTSSCLQGNDGPGLRFRLRKNSRCEGNVSYPYLEIDVRKLPIQAGKDTTIGADNWAFRCPSPKQACEQAASGTVVFEHFDVAAGKHIPGDGSY
jgi:hypothetical protein